MILIRPIGTDFNAATNRFVRIELKSAEPRLFPPPPPGNAAPTCSFIVQAPGNVSDCTGGGSLPCKVLKNTGILFQSTSFDQDGTIVRYQWFWGDGTESDDKPDTIHHWKKTGTYEVTHIVTDNFGAQGACFVNLTVVETLTP
jgi:hypothetical protein